MFPTLKMIHFHLQMMDLIQTINRNEKIDFTNPHTSVLSMRQVLFRTDDIKHIIPKLIELFVMKTTCLSHE